MTPPLTTRHRASLLAKHLRLDQCGSALIETALVSPLLVLLFAGAIDIGRVCYVAIEVSNAAQAGAVYGSQAPEDSTGIASAAQVGAPDVSNLNVAVSTGCECSDGSSPVVNCTSTPVCGHNVVHYVEVDTSTTDYPIILVNTLPASFPLSGKARMRAAY
ncbi:TadE/TadG family type IV pilus assembly protein [Bryocella elongata]|nr:TadE/TadG family type IV pilus assembly protein [Bryocella elongata]